MLTPVLIEAHFSFFSREDVGSAQVLGVLDLLPSPLRCSNIPSCALDTKLYDFCLPLSFSFPVTTDSTIRGKTIGILYLPMNFAGPACVAESSSAVGYITQRHGRVRLAVCAQRACTQSVSVEARENTDKRVNGSAAALRRRAKANAPAHIKNDRVFPVKNKVKRHRGLDPRKLRSRFSSVSSKQSNFLKADGLSKSSLLFPTVPRTT